MTMLADVDACNVLAKPMIDRYTITSAIWTDLHRVNANPYPFSCFFTLFIFFPPV